MSLFQYTWIMSNLLLTYVDQLFLKAHQEGTTGAASCDRKIFWKRATCQLHTLQSTWLICRFSLKKELYQSVWSMPRMSWNCIGVPHKSRLSHLRRSQMSEYLLLRLSPSKNDKNNWWPTKSLHTCRCFNFWDCCGGLLLMFAGPFWCLLTQLGLVLSSL